MTRTAFEADLCPGTEAPRMRFNFPNGWTASILLRQLARHGPCNFDAAAIAAWPTGQHGQGKTEIVETEAGADEIATFLAEVARREPIA